MRKYPEYKTSGIKWLGEIPSGWNATLLKRSLHEIKDGTHGSFKRPEEGKPLLSAKNVQSDKIDISESESVISEEDYNSIIRNGYPQKNDLLLTIVGTIGRAYVYDLDYPLAFQRSVAFLRFKKDNNIRFYYYQVQSSLFLDQLFSLAKTSAQSGVYLSDIKGSIALIPPLSEQHSIVRFLDYKTGQIDRFIANRQRQIELLKEQKAGIINKAVTKGINPNAKMKPSGIDWLEEVPEHWMVGKVRRVLDILTDFTANGSFADLAKNVKYLDTPDYSRLIRLTDLREDLKNDGIYVSKEAHEYLSKSVLYGGEILMANVGAYAGLVCLVPNIDYTATLGPNMFLLKFEEKRISNQYAFTLLGSDCYYRLLMNKALSSAQPKLNKEDLKSIDFIFPPTQKEQQEILDFIQEETSNIDILIAKYQKQIDLMQEYRTSLISQAVTGKIDVRDWEPKGREYKTEDLPLSTAAEK